MSNKKWWQPHNPKSGFLGVLHAVKNVFVELVRKVLTAIRFNPMLGDKDLARRIVDVAVFGLLLYLVVSILGGIGGEAMAD